jgi:ABC-2 type transport system permease protein
MTASLAIVRATLRQVLGARRVLLFGLLAVFPSFVYFMVSANQSGGAVRSSFLDTVNVHFTLTVPITALILAAASLGAERRDETLSFIVVRPIRRSAIAGAKLVAAFAAAAALNASGAAVMGLLYGWRSESFDAVLPLVAGSIIATAVYIAIFVPLGYLSERSTLIGLAFVFVWENGIVGALGVLGVTSPWRIGYSAFAGLGPSTLVGSVDDFIATDLTMSAASALTQASLFAAVSVVALTWVLRNRDLV